MKKLLSLLLVGAMAAMVSCSEDDGGSGGTVTITGIPASASIENEATYSVEYTVAADAGLVFLGYTKDGEAGEDIVLEDTPDTYTGTFEYTAVEADADQNLVFVFTATDANGNTETTTLVLSVGEAPEFEIIDPITVSGTITEDATWGPYQIVNIEGRVIVADGVTLTINPGTIVKGAEGEGTAASVLMVARGGTLNAVGTAELPIIMTTVLDDIQVGQLAGTYGETGTKGKWGGLVVLGKAPISVDGATEAQIEGVPGTEPLGLYGGNVANDNSGTIQYVSIRFGGAVIDATAGDEINGLTLGGVGSGTTIDHIEIFANVDDGVEFFGGTVDASDILVSFQGDDALDVDQAYAGTVSNFLLLQDDESDEGLEIDGPEGDLDDSFTIQNGTIRSVDGAGSVADFKSGSMGTVNNVLWEGYDEGSALKIRASYQNDCADPKSDAFTNLTDASPALVFTNVQFDDLVVSVYTGSQNDAETVDCTVPGADQTAAEGEITSGTATGASDDSAWDGWTITSIRGLLD